MANSNDHMLHKDFASNKRQIFSLNIVTLFDFVLGTLKCFPYSELTLTESALILASGRVGNTDLLVNALRYH